MTLMIAGLVLFIGIHLVPMVPAMRERLVMRMGALPYRGLFSAIAAIGLVLIVVGYYLRPERVSLFSPSATARAYAPALIALSFVLFAAANMKTHIRRRLRHPMLFGLILWSGVHLLANGDLVGTILFGSFLVWALVDLASVISRGAVAVFTPSIKFDLMAVVGGFVLAWLTMRFHPYLFGTPPVV